MTTAMYLYNLKEMAAAARAAKGLGYKVTQRELRNNDRFVMNVAAWLAGGDGAAQRELEQAIVNAVTQERR